MNNIAERAGKISKPDKSRFYTIAIGSATESAAMLDVCLRRQLIATETHQHGKRLLDRIVAMLVKLSRAMRDQVSRTAGGSRTRTRTRFLRGSGAGTGA